MAGRPCDFSESTFAFNFTENLCRRARSSIQFAPIFPTLRQEGRLDMGYDVLIRFGAVPVLFQFKIPDFISRRSGDHRAQFAGPFYRFKIMPSRVSTQHQALLNHERLGTPVRYASPRFHLMMDLNSFSAGGHVPAHSKIIPPSVIGPLPDPADHHFDYDPRGPQYLVCSKPAKGEGDYSLDSLLHSVKAALADQKNRDTAVSRLDRFISQASKSMHTLEIDFPFPQLEKLHPVQQSALLAQSMGCAFFLALPELEHRSEPAAIQP